MYVSRIALIYTIGINIWIKNYISVFCHSSTIIIVWPKIVALSINAV